ncbi:DUF4296 domain-containing protein [Pontibacter amylolyticus]|nr:DUF4296 domain-containing protein [Pontibacter amylolyticus]
MKRILYLLSFAVLAGCGQSPEKRPADLLPENKMVQILADVHIAESRIETHVLYPDTALMVFNKEQQQILAEHGVTQEDFRRTYRYYLSNLAQMDKLYEIILDTLSVREAKLRATDTTNAAPRQPPVPILEGMKQAY